MWCGTHTPLHAPHRCSLHAKLLYRAQGLAAALRAKHGKLRGADSPPKVITSSHVDSAAKVAAIMEVRLHPSH